MSFFHLKLPSNASDFFLSSIWRLRKIISTTEITEHRERELWLYTVQTLFSSSLCVLCDLCGWYILLSHKMPDKEKNEFAIELLKTVLDKKEYINTLIKARLKNWDPERIAALDMILMQMGVCEFLYFPTIPPKVTINEYIDIAKEYSTQQSGQFVNGILDNIHKELVQQNKLHKTDFKKA